MKSIGITGVGKALPNRVLTNAELEKIVDTSDEWIRTRTGICERRIADPLTGTSVLSKDAALAALKQAGLEPKDVDLLIVGTTTPDMPLPSCACLVQKEIGAVKAACFDLAAACSGFVYSFATAHQFLLSGMYKNALVIGADQLSAYLDWKDRSTCVLFGDAAGACVLEEVAGRGIMANDLGSDGNFQELICVPAGGSRNPATQETVANSRHYLKMNGQETFKNAVRGMTGSVKTILKKSNISLDEVSCIIPHQANKRIIEAVGSRLDVKPEKIFMNLDKYGNTSAASTILGLSEAIEQGRVKKGDLVLLTTFGAGLVWASTLFELSL